MDQRLKRYIKDYYNRNFGSKRFNPGKDHIPASGKFFNERELYAMVEAVLDGWWTEGRFASSFEKLLARLVGVRHAVTANSGSSANLLAISALTSPHLGRRRLRRGDEVVTLAAGFPTTINPIVLHRLTPHFVDVNLKTMNVDVGELARAIGPRTRAIFLPHHFGNPFDLRAVTKIAKRHNLWLIEDCCDALGSRYNNKWVGSFGDLATFSFYAAHHVTTGEGGAVVSNNAELASIVRSFRDWGREYWFKTGEDIARDKGLGATKLSELPADYDQKFVFSELGFNLKITDIQAALGLVQLSKLEQFADRRQSNYNYLLRAIEPYKHFFILPNATLRSNPSWFGFLLVVKPEAPFTRAEIVSYLHDRNVGTRMFFAGNVMRQPYFRAYRIRARAGALPNTDFLTERSFWIGVHQGIDRPRLTYMGAALKSFLDRYV